MNAEEILKNKTVLYVEDDETTVKFMKKIIGKYVKEVLVAYNGKEGLNTYLETKPDITITDIEMPEMNGIEMIDKIREIEANQAIVILTAFEDEAIKNSTKVSAILVKPIEKEKLKKVLLDCI